MCSRYTHHIYLLNLYSIIYCIDCKYVKYTLMTKKPWDVATLYRRIRHSPIECPIVPISSLSRNGFVNNFEFNVFDEEKFRAEILSVIGEDPVKF